MDLNQLVVFVEVVRAGSFTAAARRLDMPKSTVSRRVSELEARLGAQLLQRTTRQLRLTDVGAAYYERVARVVEDARAAEDLVAELHDVPCGVLRVSAPLTFAFLGPIVAEYARRHPSVRVDMVCTDRVVDLLGEGFDVAVRAARMPDSSLIARRLGVVRRYVVAAPGYLERRAAPREPADLSAHDTVLFSGGDDGGTWPLRAGRKRAEVELEPRLRVNDYDVLLEAVYAGVGLALMPDYLCEPELGGRLRRVLPEWKAPDIAVHAVYYGGHTSKKVTAFLDLLKERFASGARAGRG